MKELIKRLNDLGYIVHKYNHEDEYISFRIMSKSGDAYCRVSQYLNEYDKVYLDCLSVEPQSRNKGIGIFLQNIREEIGVILGANKSYLSVKVDSWMYHWYIRRGYEFYYKDEDEYDFLIKDI